MSHYADSSFWVSCYLLDAHTAQAKAWLSRTGAPLPFTALHGLEVRNAFKLGLFRGLFTSTDAAAAWRNVERDLRGSRLVRTTVKWPVAFRFAARFSERHAATMGAGASTFFMWRLRKRCVPPSLHPSMPGSGQWPQRLD